jgi:hypothetical protein
MTDVSLSIFSFDTVVNSGHRPAGDVNSGELSVRELQGVVIRWMARQLERLQWSAERWAKEADLSPTTVTRAMSKSYNSVSSVPTLHALARAAGVPSILDFMEGQVRLNVTCPVMTAALRELLPFAGVKLDDATLERVSQALVMTLVGLAEQEGDAGADPDLAAKLARAARAAIRHS